MFSDQCQVPDDFSLRQVKSKDHDIHNTAQEATCNIMHLEKDVISST